MLEVHPHGADKIRLFAAVLYCQSVQHRLDDLIPGLWFDFRDQTVSRTRDRHSETSLIDELADVWKFDLSGIEFNLVGRLLAGYFQDPQDAYAQHSRDLVTQERPCNRGI